MDNKKPNILVVFSDQQRADTIGFEVNGNKVCPNLEKLAKEGVKFESAFTVQPVCGPARACIQTGVYASENGCFRNGIGLDAQPQNKNRTVAKWLRDGGYDVAYVGKWHLGSNGGPADFDIGPQRRVVQEGIPLEMRGGYNGYWLAADALEHTSHGYNGMEDLSWKDGENPPGYMWDKDCKKVEFTGYRVDCQTDFILDYIENYAPKPEDNKPWFLFTSFIEPHHQNDHNRYEGPEGSKEMFNIAKKDVPKDLWGAEWLQKGDWEENLPDYYGQCWSLDRNVQRMIDKLKELDIYENTVIIYFSDHGSHFRTRRGEYKRNACDGCLHVPLIISGPGFNGEHSGKKIIELVDQLDITSTILKVARVNIPEHVRGRPLQDLLIEGDVKTNWKNEVFAQISESQIGRCIRTEKWKYSVRTPSTNLRGISRSPIYIEEFLFDLEKDPHELENLVNTEDHIEVRKQLEEQLIKKMVEVDELKPLILPASTQSEDGSELLTESGVLLMVDKQLHIAINDVLSIPLEEILDEILDHQVELLIDKRYYGKLAISEGILELQNNSGETTPLKELLKDKLNTKFSISAVYSPKSSENDAEYFVFLM